MFSTAESAITTGRPAWRSSQPRVTRAPGAAARSLTAWAVVAARRDGCGGGRSGARLHRLAHAGSASTSRWRSRSSFQAPTDARSHGRSGMLRTITPCSASSARSLHGVGAGERHQRAVAARGGCAAVFGEHRHQARGERARVLVHCGPAGGLEHADGGERAGGGLGVQRHRVEAPRVLVHLRVEPGVGVGEVDVAASGDAQTLAQRGADPQRPGAVRSAQPLLPGAGVGVAAERVHVHGDGADALGAVEQHRHVELAELGGRQRAADPADVRAGDQPRARTDRVGDLRERHFAHLDAAQLARGGQRAQQPGVLLVAGEDLIAAAKLQATDRPAPCLRSCRW